MVLTVVYFESTMQIFCSNNMAVGVNKKTNTHDSRPYQKSITSYGLLALGMMTSYAQNSPSLVYAYYSQSSAALMQFSRGYSFHLCYFGNSFTLKLTSLHFSQK